VTPLLRLFCTHVPPLIKYLEVSEGGGFETVDGVHQGTADGTQSQGDGGHGTTIHGAESHVSEGGGGGTPGFTPGGGNTPGHQSSLKNEIIVINVILINSEYCNH
jgi:hypothetical protein